MELINYFVVFRSYRLNLPPWQQVIQSLKRLGF